MIKRLAVYISVLAVFILSMTTGVYFAQSKKLIMDDVHSQAELILRMKKNGIESFLRKAQYLTLAISEDATLKGFFTGDSSRQQAEKLFMNYSNKIEDIQAMRLVDKKGDILVFVREFEVLSAEQDYEPINLSNRNFFQKVRSNNPKSPVFSDFERGHLPDATSFCPSMIRSLIPLFSGDRVLGYLIINFWGSKIGETVSQLDNERATSFIVETNTTDVERNGVFLFHRDRKYEFANQFGTSYFFENVYGENAFRWLMQEKSPVLNMDQGYMFCTTLSPYETDEQVWKVCTILNSEYFFRSLHVLRRDFLAVMFLSIILSILTAAVFSRYFMKPYAEIKSAVKAFSEGDFDHELKGDYHDEINEIVISIRAMAESLKEYIENIKSTQTKLELMNRLSALGVMAGGISHELNTPLNSIILLTRLVKEEIPGQSEDLDTIESEAKRCVDIIRNLRNLAPDKANTENPEKVDMKDLLEGTLKYVTFPDEIELKTFIGDASVKGYPTLLRQMIINLVKNAQDSITGKGVISIEVKDDGDYAMLMVKDTGAGFDEDEKGKIFDPFYTTKSPEKGMGLGLSLVHNIVKKHGGTITAESEKGSGTIFTVRLEKFDESSSD